MSSTFAEWGVEYLKKQERRDQTEAEYNSNAVTFDWITPFKPEFIIVILTHYKPRIAVAILDL